MKTDYFYNVDYLIDHLSQEHGFKDLNGHDKLEELLTLSLFKFG